METIDDIRCIFDFDTTELNILPSCDINDTSLTILFNTVSIKSHLVRIDNTVGNLQAHHKLARCSLATVKHTNKFQASVEIIFFDFLPSHFTLTNFSGIFVNVNPGSTSIFLHLCLLNWASDFASFNCLGGKE
mmetsp:Transcript_11074/g.31559  ORF Transcript_11074/g.31559 Transcript_11074/m.31559 type:complete len:133 (+) Transcript_11074:1337-1735(+)